MSSATMQAIRVYEYGGVEQLHLETVARPEPAAHEVLVRVLAAGVNPIDWKIRSGMVHAFFPMQFPYTPGHDIAGIVESVGSGVTTLQVGQAVFGQSALGAYAEYATANVATLALKPARLSFDEATAIPVGATTAWQGLFDHGQLQAGQRVLILGAAGGVGLFAVQFAREKGAQVIGTASTKNLDFVRSLGAESVIDYTTTDVGTALHDIDLVLDTVGGTALATVLPVLKRGGALISIAGQPDEAKAAAAGVRTARFGAQVSGELLTTFAQLIDEGKVKVAVAEKFSLAQAGEAHTLSAQGHGRGRIVLHIAE